MDSEGYIIGCIIACLICSALGFLSGSTDTSSKYNSTICYVYSNNSIKLRDDCLKGCSFSNVLKYLKGGN
jgi:hypothetical protein